MMGNSQKITKISGGNTRIGVLCLPGLQTFLPEIVCSLERKYDVRTYYGGVLTEIEDVIEWADILWFEWANELLVGCSNTYSDQLHNKKVIVRLHSYEVLSGFCQKIRWDVVDTIIFVAEHICEVFRQMVPGVLDQIESHVINNGVDLNKFRRAADA